jgi:hypothetical protein
MRYTLSWRDSFVLKITVSIPLAAWNRAFHIFTPNYGARRKRGDMTEFFLHVRPEAVDKSIKRAFPHEMTNAYASAL